ncbi:DNA-binding response regulator [Paenibacillus selenitireducens]|uniref:DNA-binding response regulator n=1 Tax=Paenibacillus selenitireducens TaxID=1324314 RepID=A0A1T2XCN3_9BACL|nr:response regulator transcription factor [Paenibacillus selenitireducens]OPA77677.1 DNA-binding response regulator [Paenibacillus selenitireducens]
MRKILVIEDERNLARFIELELKHESFEVLIASDGRTGLEMALSGDWDIILLDIMLPGMNGMDICRQIRLHKSTPIIMITARDSVSDRVTGLDTGADDYIPKPFAIEELLARIRSIFRRVEEYKEGPRDVLVFQDLQVDLNAHVVHMAEQLVELTKREFDLLVMFMQNINRVLTREVLLDAVWGFDTEVETNVVDVYVRYLRNKLKHVGLENAIHTIRGTGYVMRQ